MLPLGCAPSVDVAGECGPVFFVSVTAPLCEHPLPALKNLREYVAHINNVSATTGIPMLRPMFLQFPEDPVCATGACYAPSRHPM